MGPRKNSYDEGVMRRSKLKVLAVVLTATMMMSTSLAYASETKMQGITESNASFEVMSSSGNIDNRPYSFTFQNTSSTQGTVGRAKEDGSKCYIHIKTKTVDSCRVYIDGAVKKTGPKWRNETCRKNTTTVGGYCVANRKGEFSIQNRVKQNYYNYARLTAWGNSLPGKLAGDWSPDSSKSYTILNHA